MPTDPSRSPTILAALEAVIAERKGRPLEERSYVASLLRGGVSKIGSKINEEAAELVEAADESGPEGRSHLIHEAADLVFHTLVLLGLRDVAWSDVEAELGRRFGVGGFVEKESRGQKPTT